MSILEKIETLTIGPTDASLNFSKRLARENSWSPEFAERVITEYKRFIYLVSISQQELTPSDQLDQAWHLHLTYTQSYWGDLCRDILGFELHHLPTEGGPAEQARFRKQYQDTLNFYRQTFSANPPEDIWPSVDDRFDSVEKFVRLNRAHAWIIKRPKFINVKTVSATILPLFLVACTEELADKDIWFWLKVLFGVWVIYKVVAWMAKHSKGGGDGGCGSACGGCGGGD